MNCSGFATSFLVPATPGGPVETAVNRGACVGDGLED
jgi:hypothetical protein